MLTARFVDERIVDEYNNRNIRGPVHLSIGQEGIASGVLTSCRVTDCVVSTHRCHAHYLAKGGDMPEMVDELYGLPTGCCRGNGGSMHLFDRKVNMWGASAVLGGSIPLACGLAHSLKRKGDDICVAFIGDGGTDEGVFYEALNLTATLGLPVLFVVENNQLSTLTPLSKRQAQPDIAAKVRGFGIESVDVDGNDVIEVYSRAARLIASVRRDSAPRVLVANTHRLCAHVGPVIYQLGGIGGDDELEMKLGREPLNTFVTYVRDNCPGLLDAMDRRKCEILAAVDSAFAGAKERFAAQLAQTNLPAPPPPEPSRV